MKRKYTKPCSEIVKLNLNDSLLAEPTIPVASGEIGHGEEEAKPVVFEIEDDDNDNNTNTDIRFNFSIWDDF